MYCPTCFNDTLKIASSGVAKLTFNGKSKSTSQFYYNIKQERPAEIYKKFRETIVDYFEWYSTFQNKDAIKEINLFSSDFVCTRGCKMTIQHKMNIIDLIIPKKIFAEIIQQEADRYGIPIKLKL